MQRTRRLTQFAFVTLTLVAVFVVGANAERWCPFGGVEAAYTYATEGNLVCSLGVSNFYILGAVLLMTLLLRRAFCGYVCPIGAISEWLQGGARRLGLRPRRVPYKLDRALSLLKYAVLAIILFITWRAAELHFRAFDPCYALLSRHGEDITFWAYVVAGAIVLGSLFVMVPFCRWLCPLAAVLNPFSRFGLTRVHRTAHTCIDCGVCARACPMGIQVDRAGPVTAARCTSCFECVDACPSKVQALKWTPATSSGRALPRGLLVVAALLCITAAVAASYAVPIPSFVKTHGERPASVATMELEVQELTCRGRATLLVYFLERDDLWHVPGFWRLEAWPGPGSAKVRVIYDPTRSDPDLIKAAMTEPYYDAVSDRWRTPPFRIEGYDPLAL